MTYQSIISKSNRFASALGHSGKKEPWDRALLETNDFVVVPTKGSIIRNWVLLIPKVDALNFAEVRDHSDQPNAINWLRQFAAVACEKNYIWFEHGASRLDSETGCGVDYAHIHILLAPEFSLDTFSQGVEQLSELKAWRSLETNDAYSSVPAEQDYYVFGNGLHAKMHCGSRLGRQFFRRVIANLSGKSDQWDYNRFTFEQNVRLTVADFVCAERVA